jgi:hypothetical protein
VQAQRGSVRLALLCALAGAAAVFIWNARQPSVNQAPASSSQTTIGQRAPDLAATAVARAQPSAAPGASTPGGAAGVIEGDATRGEALAADTAKADAATPTDADGFSPDYGALVDDFQQQRALDPLVDE